MIGEETTRLERWLYGISAVCLVLGLLIVAAMFIAALHGSPN